MRKYLELFTNGFDATIAEKTKVENWPYVGHSPSEGVKFTVIPTKPKVEYKMVDLGLPSGLLWADRNVGATSEYDYGLYFQWGDTKGYTKEQVEAGEVVLNGENYFDTDKEFGCDKYGNPISCIKYNNEGGLTILESVDDAATVHMGTDWRMPTVSDWQELIDNTTLTIVQSDGITEITFEDLAQNYLMPNIDFTGAFKCTSKINNNSILIAPNLRSFQAAPEDTGAALWLSELSVHVDGAIAGMMVIVPQYEFNWEEYPRYMPMPVRGVRMPEEEIIMTSESNPVVMSVCYNQGWAANPDYMTKREAEKVTDIGNAFDGPYSGGTYVLPEFDSDVFIKTFNELQYFTSISNLSLYFQKHLTTITIPHNIKFISLTGTLSLTDIYYLGTKEEWNNSSVSESVGKYSPKGALTIHCTDGDIEGLGENDKIL